MPYIFYPASDPYTRLISQNAIKKMNKQKIICGYPYPTNSFSTNPSSNPSGLTASNSGAQHPHPTSRY
jgi:hypothetical protein